MKCGNFKIGEKVQIIDCNYSRKYGKSGVIGEVVCLKTGWYDYQIKFEDGKTEFYYHDELIPLPSDTLTKTTIENPLIITAPTFNISEIPCGSLVYVNKGYLQLQGFVAAITPTTLSLAFYDDEDEHGTKCSIETVDITRVVSGEQTIEVIRKAIPLEV